MPSKGRSSTCVRYLLVHRRRICARGSWTRVGPPSRGYPPTHRTRPDVQSHLWACTLHTHMHLFVQARTYLCAQIHTCTHTLSMLHLAVHTLPTHLLILAIRKQCLSNAMGESPSFYLLIDIGHKYFGSCENVAVVKVNYLLRGGLSTGIWTNCVQIWDKIRDGGSIYIADDSAPPFSWLLSVGDREIVCRENRVTLIPSCPSSLTNYENQNNQQLVNSINIIWQRHSEGAKYHVLKSRKHFPQETPGVSIKADIEVEDCLEGSPNTKAPNRPCALVCIEAVMETTNGCKNGIY